MAKVILNYDIFDKLSYPLHTLKKILKSEGFDLTKTYMREDDFKYNRITFTQNEQLECGS